MITSEQAKQIANNIINGFSSKPERQIVLVEDATIEKPYGWVFFYNSAKYLETNDLRHALIGNAPFVVFKKDGSTRILGTAIPINKYLEELEKEFENIGET